VSVALFHTADYHIGAYRWVPDYLSRTKLLLEEIVDVVRATVADTKILVIAGDFWDRTDLTEDERVLGSWFLASVLLSGAYVIQTLGNHEFVDEQGMTLIHSQSHWSALAAGRYFVVANAPSVVRIPTDLGEYQFLCLPCTQKRDTAEFIRDVALLRDEAGPKLGPRYVIMHEAISSAKDTRGGEIRLSKSLVVQEDPDIDGYLLGDIHTRQSFGSKTWYCGAPIQVKRDESPETGMLLWDKSVATVIPLDRAPKFKITTKVEDVAVAASSESSDIVFYVGSEQLPDVACLPKNIVLDPNYSAADVTGALAHIVSSECRDEAVAQLPAFLAELGHPESEQLEAVNYVVALMDRIGVQ
jgi:DNA repair exonuclease SbcCD nuclease subunit